MENRFPFHTASLQFPAMPDPEATAYRRRADWVLLDKVAYIADRPNGTTAQGFTHAGQAIQVSFWLADPPALSQLCIHCPGLKAPDFAEEPTVVCSEKDIAIFQIQFSSSGPNINPVHRGQRMYFVYKANQEQPSLDPLPVPSPLCFGNDEFGLLPGTDGFHIAVLRQHPQLGTGDYDLHTFSSKTWAWSTQLARLSLGAKGVLPCHKAHKVVVLDGNTLGFVDLWEGILCCRVDDDSPVLPLRHIRLPPPMHINKGMFDCASGIRDVICINGMIKFIEIANRERKVICEQSDDLSHNNGELLDSDLDELANNAVDAKDVYAYDGWSVVTWKRQASSDRWLSDCQVDVNDVTVCNPRHLDLLPQLSSSHSGKLNLNKNLLVSAPAFGLQDKDVVYLMCKLEIMDKTAWVLAINTREKALEDLAFFTGRTCYFYRTYCPYTLSKHMKMAALGHRVGCRVKRDDDKTVPIGTTILVHGLDACVTEDQLVSTFAMFGELSGLSIPANQQYALVRFVTRACAEKAMCRMNGNQLGRQKVVLSWGSDTRDKQANANQCNGDADSYSQSHGYYEMQLKPLKPSYTSSSTHQSVGGNKKLKLNVGG
ncbi:unnamed protein product [Urochloa humidicola]